MKISNFLSEDPGPEDPALISPRLPAPPPARRPEPTGRRVELQLGEREDQVSKVRMKNHPDGRIFECGNKFRQLISIER